MRRKLFPLFLALVAGVGTMFAEKVQIGDLYYNLNATDQTAVVTYELEWNENNYQGLTTANIPASVTYNDAVYSITSIGESAFLDCSSLTSVTIPNSVTSIGEYAFRFCSSLNSVIIPNSVTSIGQEAFFHCSSLTSITIPNSVTSIGESAFLDCSSLTSVTIPNSVTSIGDKAFWNCSGLTSITIPNSVTSIGSWAFEGCSSLTSPVYNEHVFAYMPTSYSGDYSIPEGIENIAGGAFAGCRSLTSVTIPNSVTSIGGEAFWVCTNLTSIIVEAGNTAYDSRDNCNAIIETSTNTLIAGCQNTVIPNSVTSIGDDAFYYCSSLTSVTIPNSVTSIGDHAFFYCSSLTSVIIPNSVTSIGNSAFESCSSLTSVAIPNSVTSIGDGAFYECIGLTSVYNYAATPQAIYSNVFYELNLSTCTLYVPEESIELYRAANVWKEFGSIVGIAVPEEPQEPELVEDEYVIHYVDKNSNELHQEAVTLQVPVAPQIAGFTFIGWQASGMLEEDGIILQAVYTADTLTSSPAIVVNPANKALKLIRNGNVYILTDTKTYTIQGQVK